MQPSTQSSLHVSGTESVWQVLPQVDTQTLYSIVSSHERATQMKQITHITSQVHKKQSTLKSLERISPHTLWGGFSGNTFLLKSKSHGV